MLDAEIIGPVAVLLVLAYVVKLFLDHRLKVRLIEKGLVDEKVKYLYTNTVKTQIMGNLKWGLVLVAIGVAAMCGWWFPDQVEDEGLLGLMFLLAGVALLIYYVVAPKLLDKDDYGPRVP